MNAGCAQVRMLGAAMAVAATAACGGKDKVRATEVTAGEAKDRYAIDSARMEAERAAAAAPSELAGSSWRLVRFQSSDDTVLTPEAQAVYTVEFGTDGRVSVVGGCNRGSGPFTVTAPSGLAFGPLATTRAMCPPGSMSARFLGDFAHMRAYQLVGGRLYVSLMADGGIYEFAPEEVAVSPASNEQIIFVCTDSTGARSRILATFAGGPGSVTLERGGKSIVVPQVPSGSGARYEGAGVVFWNKGRDAMVTWAGVNLNCATTKQ